MHHSSTLILHVGLPAEYPRQSAVCGSVRSVDGRDGNWGRRGENAICPEVGTVFVFWIFGYCFSIESKSINTVLWSTARRMYDNNALSQVAPPPAWWKPPSAATRYRRVALYPRQRSGQPDECFQLVRLHRSQYALVPGTEHSWDGGGGHQKGDEECANVQAHSNTHHMERHDNYSHPMSYVYLSHRPKSARHY